MTHIETLASDNPGVFLGLFNFTAALYSILNQHLESATVLLELSRMSCLISCLKLCSAQIRKR